MSRNLCTSKSVAVLVGLLAVAGQAATATFTAGTDITMVSAFPTSVYTTFSHLEFGPDYDGAYERKALIYFDLSSLAGKYSTIDQVTLTLYRSRPELTNDVMVNVYRVLPANAGWNRSFTSWNNKNQNTATPWAGSPGLGTPNVDYDPTPIGSFLFSGSTLPDGAAIAITLSASAIDTMIRGTNAGILLKYQSYTGSGDESGDVRDYEWGSTGPNLQISYTYPISRGRQIIIDNGLLISGWVDCSYGNEISPNQYSNAHYSMIDGSIDAAGVPQLGTMKLGRYSIFDNGSYVIQDPVITFSGRESQVFGLNYEDEPGPHTHPGELPLLNSGRLSSIRDQYDAWRAIFTHALMHVSTSGLREYTTNSDGTGGTEAGLRTYTQTARPDMLMFDIYPSYLSYSDFVDDGRSSWYSAMASFRKVGLEGIDGTGHSPIVYGQYTHMYRANWTDPVPSESFVRLQRFASLAFGFQYIEDYKYLCHGGNKTVMFADNGDENNVPPTATTDAYKWVAGTYGACGLGANQECLNLGPYLARLVSVGNIYMLPERYHNFWGYHNRSVPGGMVNWGTKAGGTGDCLTSVRPVATSGQTDYLATFKDILIGYFRPLKASNPDYPFVDGGLHFMIVNTDFGYSAVGSAVTYCIEFDFAGTNYNAIQYVDRLNSTPNANIITVPTSQMVSLGNNKWRWWHTFWGGTGELFKFTYN